jgi:hypothetical protein
MPFNEFNSTEDINEYGSSHNEVRQNMLGHSRATAFRLNYFAQICLDADAVMSLS